MPAKKKRKLSPDRAKKLLRQMEIQDGPPSWENYDPKRDAVKDDLKKAAEG